MEGLQNNSADSVVKQGIQRILRFTNTVDEEDLVIEDCATYKKDLAGYHIVLPRSRFKDMCFLMTKIYTEYEDTCTAVFNSGNDEDIVHLCKIFAGNITYTEQFIRLSGGLEKLLYEINSFSEEDLMEEEDPEMIKELQEQIAELNKKAEEVEAKHQEELKELQDKIDAITVEKDEFKKYFEGLELENGDIELCLNVIEQLSREQLQDLVFSVLSTRAGEEGNTDLNVLTLYINDIAEALMNLGILDELENMGA